MWATPRHNMSSSKIETTLWMIMSRRISKKRTDASLCFSKVCSVSRALETYVWSSFFYTCYGTADFKRSVCPMTSCTGPHFSISLFSRSNFPIARRLFLIVLLIVLTFSFNTLRTIWG